MSKNKITMTADELEERRNHSFVAGEHSTLQTVVATLKARAAELFTADDANRDALAYEVRRLANEFDKQRHEAHVKLDDHIKRSMDRRKTAGPQ